MTVDTEVIEAAAAAVREGRAASVSAWVNEVLTQRAAKERRLAAAAEAIAAYEAEFGVITDEEMAEQERADREAAARWRAEWAARQR